MDCSLPGSSIHADSPGKNTGVGSHALLQGIFPTQGSNPGLQHCRWVLHCLSHQGSPRILEWVAHPFSRGTSPPRNRTGVSCIIGGFFTSRATREALNWLGAGGIQMKGRNIHWGRRRRERQRIRWLDGISDSMDVGLSKFWELVSSGSWWVGEGGLARCSPWGYKESDTTERLNGTPWFSSQIHFP